VKLDASVDLSCYGARPLWLLVAATAARYSAERDIAGGIAGFLFWSLLFLACWILRPGLRKGKDAAKKVEQAGNAVAIVGLLLFFLNLIAGGIEPAVLAVLFAGQAALVLIAEKRIHLWLMLGAALAAVLFAASTSRSPLFLPCAAWFTFAALGVLTADHAVECSQRLAMQPLETPAAGTLGQHFGRGGRIFAVLTLLLALPLYLFLPKPGALLIGGMQAASAQDYRDYNDKGTPLDVHPQDPQSKLKSGLPVPLGGGGPDSSMTRGSPVYGDSFPLESRTGGGSGSGRDGSDDNGILMYVQSSHPVYLRGKLYDRFENNRWWRDPGTPQRRELQRGYYEEELPPGGAEAVRQQIEVVADLDAALYLAPGTYQLRFPGPVVSEYADGTLAIPRALRAGTTYSAEARLDLRNGRYLIRQDQLAGPTAYLQLPADLSTRIRDLAHQVADGVEGPDDKALAVEHYLRSNYQYSFDTIIPFQGVTPLDWFLFEHKRGHCEFFASAAVVMLRSLGIPARLATGFSLGEKNPVTGFYEVRGLDGHAWAEVYLPQRGWMMLEPTPFYPLPLPESQQQVAAQTDRYLDRRAQTAEMLNPGSVKSAALAAMRDIWHLLRSAQWQAAQALQSLGWWLPALLLLALLLAPGIHLLRLRLMDRAHNRRVLQLLGRAQRAAPGEAALWMAAALEQGCGARLAARPDGATFREYYERLRTRHEALPASFADTFDDLRYGDRHDLAAAAGYPLIARVVRGQLAQQPAPRFSRQLGAWRQALQSLFRRR